MAVWILAQMKKSSFQLPYLVLQPITPTPTWSIAPISTPRCNKAAEAKPQPAGGKDDSTLMMSLQVTMGPLKIWDLCYNYAIILVGTATFCGFNKFDPDIHWFHWLKRLKNKCSKPMVDNLKFHGRCWDLQPALGCSPDSKDVRKLSWNVGWSRNNQQKTLRNVVTGWWFQPIWKILVKLDHFPSRGENKKYLKPPPSC